MTDGYEFDGKIAVLISPGFGAGWSTWASRFTDKINMAFDHDIIKAVLAEDKNLVLKLVREKYPDQCDGGVETLEVQWVTKGDLFEITEYDGAERVRVFKPEEWLTA